MVVKVILSALLGAAIGFMAAGFGAAAVLISALGDHDGGSSMEGFFVFGPIGALSGALLAVGLVLRFSGYRGLGKVPLIGAGIVTAFGCIALTAVASTSDRRPSYSYAIEFQLEVPAATLATVEIPSGNAMWGAAGGDSDDKPISQFFEKKCEGETCVIGGSIAALGPMDKFRIATVIGSWKSRYPLNLPAVISGPADWSGWRSDDGARVRWRIVAR